MSSSPFPTPPHLFRLPPPGHPLHPALIDPPHSRTQHPPHPNITPSSQIPLTTASHPSSPTNPTPPVPLLQPRTHQHKTQRLWHGLLGGGLPARPSRSFLSVEKGAVSNVSEGRICSRAHGSRSRCLLQDKRCMLGLNGRV